MSPCTFGNVIESMHDCEVLQLDLRLGPLVQVIQVGLGHHLHPV